MNQENAMALISAWNPGIAGEVQSALGTRIDGGFTVGAGAPIVETVERRALSLLIVRDAMIKAAAIAMSLEFFFHECRQKVGEALVVEGRGGGVQVPEYKAAVLAGASFDVSLKIDDLCPPEALAPGAAGYDLTIAAAEASAEQRLVNRLDSLGLNHMAPRRVEFEALAAWIEGHEQGPAVAIKDLQGTIDVKTPTVAEVML